MAMQQNSSTFKYSPHIFWEYSYLKKPLHHGDTIYVSNPAGGFGDASRSWSKDDELSNKEKKKS